MIDSSDNFMAMVKKVNYILWSFVLLGCLDHPRLSILPTSPYSLSSEQPSCDWVLEDNSCLLARTEIFKIPKSIPVDILFIIDTSYSMEDTLNKIGKGFSSLMSYIDDDVDWRMAFTTSDHGDHQFYRSEEGVKVFPQLGDRWQDYTGSEPKFGQFMNLQRNQNQMLKTKILTKDIPDYKNIFYHTITHDPSLSFEERCQWPPFCQGDHEQPLRVLKSVIEQNAITQFFRDYAGLITFIITDEEERAEDFKKATTANEVLAKYDSTFHQSKKTFIVYGISITNSDCLNSQKEQYQESSYSYSSNLFELTKRTNGSLINICEDDYSSSFSEISKHIKDSVNEVPLEYVPVVSPSEDVYVQITITNSNGVEIPVQWQNTQLNSKSLSFSKGLPLGSELEIKYYYHVFDEDTPMDTEKGHTS